MTGKRFSKVNTRWASSVTPELQPSAWACTHARDHSAPVKALCASRCVGGIVHLRDKNKEGNCILYAGHEK